MPKRQLKDFPNPTSSTDALSPRRQYPDLPDREKVDTIDWLSVADSAPLLFFSAKTKPFFHFTYLNNGWQTITGIAVTDLLAEPQLMFTRIPADDLKKLERIHAGKKTGQQVVFRLLNKQNKWVWLKAYISKSAFHDADYSYDGVVWEITKDFYERRENKTTLELSARLRSKTYHYEMPAAILEQIINDLDPISVFIALVYPERDELFIASARGNYAPLEGYTGDCSSSRLASVLCQMNKPVINAHNKRRIASWGLPSSSEYVTLFPLSTSSTKIGLICLECRQPIQNIDILVLKAIARVSTTAINRALTHENTTRRLMRLELLHKLDIALSASLELEQTLHSITEQIQNSGVDAFRILQLEPNSKQLYLLIQNSLISKYDNSLPVQSFANQVVKSKKTLAVKHLKPEDFEKMAMPSDSSFRSYLGIPLHMHHQITGILEIFFSHPLSPAHEDQNFFETIANRISIALENSHLYAELQQKINALHAAQEQLIQQEKMAALGELVAGVAHELNNPITTILGFAQMMKQDANQPALISDLDEIILQATHASNIIHGLLDFSRQNQPNRMPVQVNELLEKSLKLAGLDLRARRIKLTKNLSPSLPLIEADEHQLLQVFINIIRNACDAMENTHDAELTILTDWMPVEMNGKGENLPPGVRVIFKDNGPGIPESILHRLFFPFFTTKKQDKGTGLGLSISYGIVTAHQGSITAENNPDGGASFTIFLPLQSKDFPAVKEQEKIKAVNEFSAIKSTILLIEDEIPLAKILSRALANNGFSVSVAHSGKEALDLLENQVFDLIVSDYFLTDINGMELFHQVRLRQPDVKNRFCLMTGDIVNPTLQEFLTENQLAYLLKPFDISQFVTFVKSWCSSALKRESIA